MSDWIFEGSLGVRFTEEHGHLLKWWFQPDREVILDHVATQRREVERQDFLGGYKVGSIPDFDWHRVVIPKYPEFLSNDPDEMRNALIRFSNDPDMQPYLVKKA